MRIIFMGTPEFAVPTLAAIHESNQEVVGEVTSGTMSPLLNEGIGMGYVPIEYTKVGTELEIQVRKKYVKAEVIKATFIQK